MYAPDHATARDARGNMSNYIQVDPWEPNVENDVLTVESPRASYGKEMPLDDDQVGTAPWLRAVQSWELTAFCSVVPQYTKEPPPAPAHLLNSTMVPRAHSNDFQQGGAGAAWSGGAGGDGPSPAAFSCLVL